VLTLLMIRVMGSVAKVVSLKVISDCVFGKDGRFVDNDVDNNLNLVVDRDASVSEAGRSV